MSLLFLLLKSCSLSQLLEPPVTLQLQGTISRNPGSLLGLLLGYLLTLSLLTLHFLLALLLLQSPLFGHLLTLRLHLLLTNLHLALSLLHGRLLAAPLFLHLAALCFLLATLHLALLALHFLLSTHLILLHSLLLHHLLLTPEVVVCEAIGWPACQSDDKSQCKMNVVSHVVPPASCYAFTH